MTTDLWLDFLGIRMDAEKADGMQFKINFINPDVKEKYVVEMSNAALTNIRNYEAKDADLTITMKRSDLEEVMMGKVSFDDQIKAGKVTMFGNKAVYDQLKTTLVQFELGFELMPGTGKASAVKSDLKPFQQPEPVMTGE
jgi:alkyl sulfatase BDS1-like metallo-beta-lactamase superfamily hydrolase